MKKNLKKTEKFRLFVWESEYQKSEKETKEKLSLNEASK